MRKHEILFGPTVEGFLCKMVMFGGGGGGVWWGVCLWGTVRTGHMVHVI